jgi:hypothetical protein
MTFEQAHDVIMGAVEGCYGMAKVCGHRDLSALVLEFDRSYILTAGTDEDRLEELRARVVERGDWPAASAGFAPALNAAPATADLQGYRPAFEVTVTSVSDTLVTAHYRVTLTRDEG